MNKQENEIIEKILREWVVLAELRYIYRRRLLEANKNKNKAFYLPDGSLILHNK